MSIPLQPTIPNTLTDRLHDAHALTAEFLSGIIAEPCRILPSERNAKADRIQQLIQSQAWTDAALALIELELPQWQVRRLVYDGGEWFCALSWQREMPDWLDQPVESHHVDLALAILDAVAQAKRISAPQKRACLPVPPSVTPMFEPVCSENFA
jgi:hypothetical protein